jgi:WD40 repeat protein
MNGDGSLVLMCDRLIPVSLWDVKSGEKLKTFGGHKDDVTSVALSGDGSLALTWNHDDDGTAILWDAKRDILLTFGVQRE